MEKKTFALSFSIILISGFAAAQVSLDNADDYVDINESEFRDKAEQIEKNIQEEAENSDRVPNETDVGPSDLREARARISSLQARVKMLEAKVERLRNKLERERELRKKLKRKRRLERGNLTNVTKNMEPENVTNITRNINRSEREPVNEDKQSGEDDKRIDAPEDKEAVPEPKKDSRGLVDKIKGLFG